MGLFPIKMSTITPRRFLRSPRTLNGTSAPEKEKVPKKVENETKKVEPSGDKAARDPSTMHRLDDKGSATLEVSKMGALKLYSVPVAQAHKLKGKALKLNHAKMQKDIEEMRSQHDMDIKLNSTPISKAKMKVHVVDQDETVTSEETQSTKKEKRKT